MTGQARQAGTHIALVDNYDSFTYNLVQYFRELGARVTVVRNDAATVAEIAALRPAALVVSPGPCDPDRAGVSMDAIRTLGPALPTLGVCLGHQCMAQVFGGAVVRAPAVVHGKLSRIRHDGRDLFAGLPETLDVVRYHSLTVDPHRVPACLDVTATTADGTIMAARHRDYAMWGVQFHPESILTQGGKQMLANFLSLVEEHGSTSARRPSPVAAGLEV